MKELPRNTHSLEATLGPPLAAIIEVRYFIVARLEVDLPISSVAVGPVTKE
jgi:hypothetical protein